MELMPILENRKYGYEKKMYLLVMISTSFFVANRVAIYYRKEVCE